MSTMARRRSSLNWFFLVSVSLLCAAGCLRFSSLSNLPGINGDEADMGLKILHMLAGQPFSLRTQAGQFFNPLFIISQVCLFKLFGHNFYLLRLPAGVFSMLGIAILAYGYGKVFRNWQAALALAVLVACFPCNMIYSRLAWDPTYLFFWTPVLLYPAMQLSQTPRRRYWWMLAACIPLAVWTHATIGPFILAMIASLLWGRREQVAEALRRRLPDSLGETIARSGTILFGVFVALGALFASVFWILFQNKAWEIRLLTPAAAWRALMAPGSLSTHLRLLGDLLSGYRPFRYVTGMPRSPEFEALSWIAEFIFFLCALRLAISKNRIDRFLAGTLFIYLLLILLEAGTMHLTMFGYERYVMALMALLPLILVRGFPKPIWLMAISVILLGQYWIYFEQPTLRCEYFLTQDRTYWTGIHEPKIEAANLIRFYARQNRTNPHPMVYSSYYWLERPLEFALFPGIDVTENWRGPYRIRLGDFVAGFAGEDFIQGAISDLKLAGRRFEYHSISNQSGVEQVIVLQIVK